MGGTIILCYIVLMKVFVHLAAPQECPPGTYLYIIKHTGQHFCIECQDGTFMPYKDHQQSLCRPCEKIREPNLELLVSSCNKTHDADIHCVDGYYRDLPQNPSERGQCRRCTECEFVGLPCSTYRDTVCCWDENFDVVFYDDVPECKQRPWFCRQGQYFDTGGFQCLPCPDNTLMPIDYHIQPECWKCREYDKYESYRPLHSIIIQPCNSTHEAVIGCEDGFFMNPKMSYRGNALGCSPCTDCSKTDVQYEGRKCDGMEDTVCCPQPNMTVVDTHGGPLCTASFADCDEGHCLHFYVRRKSTACAPCIDITDLDVTTRSRHVSSTTQGNSSAPKDTRIKASTEADCDCFRHVPSMITGCLSGVVLTALALFFIYLVCLKGRVKFNSSNLLPICFRHETDTAGSNEPGQILDYCTPLKVTG